MRLPGTSEGDHVTPRNCEPARCIWNPNIVEVGTVSAAHVKDRARAVFTYSDFAMHARNFSIMIDYIVQVTGPPNEDTRQALVL